MIKKITSILLSIIMLACMFPTLALADDTEEPVEELTIEESAEQKEETESEKKDPPEEKQEDPPSSEEKKEEEKKEEDEPKQEDPSEEEPEKDDPVIAPLIPIKIISASKTEVYSGTPVVADDYEIIYGEKEDLYYVEATVPYETIFELPSGDHIRIILSDGPSSQTYTGKTTNKIGYKLENENLYEITKEEGTIKVTPASLVITAGSESWPFDGEEHSLNEYTQSGLLDIDEIISVTISGKITDVGKKENIAKDAVIRSKDGEHDVTDCYDISYESGTLEVYSVEEETKTVNIKIVSSDPAMTDSNENFSLSGAEYTFVDENGKEYTSTTNGKGKASIELPIGKYTVSMTKAPKGYCARLFHNEFKFSVKDDSSEKDLTFTGKKGASGAGDFFTAYVKYPVTLDESTENLITPKGKDIHIPVYRYTKQGSGKIPEIVMAMFSLEQWKEKDKDVPYNEISEEDISDYISNAFNMQLTDDILIGIKAILTHGYYNRAGNEYIPTVISSKLAPEARAMLASQSTQTALNIWMRTFLGVKLNEEYDNLYLFGEKYKSYDDLYATVRKNFEQDPNKLIPEDDEETGLRLIAELLWEAYNQAELKEEYSADKITLAWDDSAQQYTGSTTVSGLAPVSGWEATSDSKQISVSCDGNNISVIADKSFSGTAKIMLKGIETRYLDNVIFFEQTGGKLEKLIGFGGEEKEVECTISVIVGEAYGSLSIRKVSSSPDVTDGNNAYSLEDAEYTLYADEKCKKPLFALNTNEKGEAFLDKIDTGTYWLKETKAPQGYTKNSKTMKLTISAGDTTYVDGSGILSDAPVLGSISVKKMKVDSQAKTKTSAEKDARFELRKGDKVIAKLTTDKKGIAKAEKLPFGKYTLVQTAGAEGYPFVDPAEVTIDAKHPDKTVELSNNRQYTKITISKRDVKTDASSSFAGVKFRIKDVDEDEYISMGGTNNFTANSKGIVMLPGILKNGHYSVCKISSSGDDEIVDKSVDFTVSKKTPIKDDILSIKISIDVKAYQETAKGKIEIYSKGQVFSGLKRNTVPFADKKFTVAKLEVTDGKLEDVVFEIKAAEKIYDGKKLVYREGDVVETIVSNEKGHMTSKSLPFGKYTIEETDVPVGYIRDTGIYSVRLSEEESIVSKSFYNKMRPLEISFKNEGEFLTTIMASQDIHIHYMKNLLSDVMFGLYNKYELNPGENISIPKNTLLATSISDQWGMVTFSEVLPNGQYYIAEVCPLNEKYIIDTTEYPVTNSEADDTATKTVKSFYEPMMNYFTHKSVVIGKTNYDGTEIIPGAMLEIEDETGSIVYRKRTGENENTRTVDLIPGDYKMRELSENDVPDPVFFSIDKNGTVTGDTFIKDFKPLAPPIDDDINKGTETGSDVKKDDEPDPTIIPGTIINNDDGNTGNKMSAVKWVMIIGIPLILTGVIAFILIRRNHN